jgi:hypothetical protein
LTRRIRTGAPQVTYLSRSLLLLDSGEAPAHGVSPWATDEMESLLGPEKARADHATSVTGPTRVHINLTQYLTEYMTRRLFSFGSAELAYALPSDGGKIHPANFDLARSPSPHPITCAVLMGNATTGRNPSFLGRRIRLQCALIGAGQGLPSARTFIWKPYRRTRDGWCLCASAGMVVAAWASSACSTTPTPRAIPPASKPVPPHHGQRLRTATVA